MMLRSHLIVELVRLIPTGADRVRQFAFSHRTHGRNKQPLIDRTPGYQSQHINPVTVPLKARASPD